MYCVILSGAARLEGDAASIHSLHTLSGPNYNEQTHVGRSVSTVGSIEPSLARGEYMVSADRDSHSRHHQNLGMNPYLYVHHEV